MSLADLYLDRVGYLRKQIDAQSEYITTLTQDMRETASRAYMQGRADRDLEIDRLKNFAARLLDVLGLPCPTGAHSQFKAEAKELGVPLP